MTAALVVDALAGLECPPLHYLVPERAATYGPEVACFGAAAGLDLDPEQQLVVDAAYAVDGADRLVSPVIGCAAPRQNVKTHVAKVCGLADLVMFRVPEAVWTAQQKDTARDAFRNKYGTGLADLFDNFDHLRRLVHTITDSEGETSIVLRPKRAGDPKPSLTFATRTERGKVGFSGPRVTFDEAPWLKPVHTAAMIPILSAQSMSGWVQVRYFGSAGHLHSATWRDVRDRGRRGELAWIEWGAPRVPCADSECRHAPQTEGCALDREDLVRAANLAVGRRIDIKFVMVTERNEMKPPENYGRERLGWWQDPPSEGTILELERWADLGIGPQPMKAPVLSVEVALDRSLATIGAAWRPSVKPHLEVVEDRPGVGWVVPRVIELARRYGGRLVVLDAGTEAAGLQPALEAAGLRVEMVNSPARVAACGSFFDAATSEGLTHSGDPALAEALASARWKDLGEGSRLFSRRRSAGDIGALYAVVLALYGLLTQPAASAGYFSMRDLDGGD